MTQHGIHIKRGSLHRVMNCFLFCGSINMQPLQAWAVRIEQISVSLNFDGYFNFQHFSQFHIAPRFA